MALMAILKSLDGIAADVATEYTEKDGKFYLQVTPVGGFALEDVGGLKTTLAEVKEKKRLASDKLSAFGDLTPESAQAAVTKVSEMDGWTPEQKVTEKMDSMKSQLTTAHKKELETRDKKIATQDKFVEELLITSRATAIIAKRGAKVGGLMPHVKAATRMRTTENGVPIVEVIDGNGNARVGDSDGNAMTIDQLIDELAENEDTAPLFPGSGATGSGAAGDASSGSPGASKIDPKLPPQERMKIARRNQAAAKKK